MMTPQPTAAAHRNARTLAGAEGCDAVVGLQWGDEGKGKVVDLIAPKYDAVVRFNGGANAGHSVVVKGERYALHLIPSGILSPTARAIIASGVVVDPEVVLKEIDGLTARGVDCSRLVISERAHVVMPYHKVEDELREKLLAHVRGGASGGAGAGGIGTTGRGIGPCYADKAQRSTGVRMGDLARPGVLKEKVELACELKNAVIAALGPKVGLGPEKMWTPQAVLDWAAPLAQRLGPRVQDTMYLLNDMIDAGKRVLFEGANAAMLDVDHGTHPYVTSSSTTSLGIPSGSGVPCARLGRVMGVMKAYSTRVGNGPLPTEQVNAIGQRIRERGREYGTTTGRPRRVGWLDLVAVRYSAMLCGATSLCVMLLDVLEGIDELNVCVAYDVGGERTERLPSSIEDLERAVPVYERLAGFSGAVGSARTIADLPAPARAYVDLIQERVGVPVGLVSVGPDREQTILV